MKRILGLILGLALLTAGPALAANWFACGTTPNFSHVSGGTTSDVWHSLTACTGGSWLDWSTGPATNDVFLGNGVTGIIVDVDPKGTAGATKVVLNTATNGGTFVITTGTITVTADLGVSGNTGTTDVLTVSGGTVSILGNIYGGGSSGADGLVISGSSTTVTTGSVGSPVTIIGGTNASAIGVNDGHTVTTTTAYATSTGGTSGNGYNNTSSRAVVVNGSFVAHATGGIVGCNANSTGAITVTGNIINGVRAFGAAGKIVWAPATAKNYIKTDGGGTAVYASAGLGSDAGGTLITAANTAAKVLDDTYFVKKDDGVYTIGTASAGAGGGGGAWGF